jgi:hypothetical protein
LGERIKVRGIEVKAKAKVKVEERGDRFEAIFEILSLSFQLCEI